MQPSIAEQAAGLAAYRTRPLAEGIRVVAIASGKGGVGKTLFSVNAALALGDMGYRILLLDGDVVLANTTILLGETPRHGLEDVARGACTLDEVALRVGERLTILTTSSNRASLAPKPGRFVGRLLQHFRTWECAADFILIDTAAGAAEDVVQWVLAAGELVVVVTPEPTSLTDAYLLCEVVQRAGFNGELGVVVNMAGSVEGKQVFDSFKRMVNTYLGIVPEFLGSIPTDREVPRAVRVHRPVLRQNPRSPASRSVLDVARAIAGWQSARHGSLPEVLGAWARRLTRWEATGRSDRS